VSLGFALFGSQGFARPVISPHITGGLAVRVAKDQIRPPPSADRRPFVTLLGSRRSNENASGGRTTLSFEHSRLRRLEGRLTAV
jgi:hypothetical protein